MTVQNHDFAAVPVLIEELPPAARFSLRVRAAHRGAIAAGLALDLPAKVGDRARSGLREVLCLGPDEWLIVTDEADRDTLSGQAAAIRADTPHSLCDISDREITLRLTGPKVLDLLATGCPRDLGILTSGRAVRTVFDSATVILWRDGATSFRMDVWRSFLPHVRTLLGLAETELVAGL